MPSVKPDNKEVTALLVARGWRFGERPPNIYAELHRECEGEAGAGYVTQAGAKKLWKCLSANSRLGSIYPNNILALLLRDICELGEWCSDKEHDLLHMIHFLYLGYGSEADLESEQLGPHPPRHLSFAIANSSFRSSFLREALASSYFDDLANSSNIAGKLVGFTGQFRFGTREACFKEARRLGAVPCDPSPHLDLLFVGREFEGRGVVSSKLDLALYFRRVYGRLLVVRERVWEAVVASG